MNSAFHNGSLSLQPPSWSYLLCPNCAFNSIFNHSLGLTLDTFHFHANWPVTCFPHAPGFGCSNQQQNFLPSKPWYSPSFSKNQPMPPAHNLLMPPVAYCCTHQFCGNKGEYFWFLWGVEPGQWEFDTTTTMLPINVVFQILQFVLSYYYSPALTLDIFPFPGAAQDIFLCPTYLRYIAKSIH